MSKLDDFKEYIKSRRVAVIGLGLSNTALINFLYEAGAGYVALYDRNDSEGSRSNAELLKSQGGINDYVLGDRYLDGVADAGFDLLFKAPVIRPDLPELKAAIEQGAVLSSETELFMELCPCRIIAITGSDGKTTTTTLVSELLKEQYKKCCDRVCVWLGGNIGTPLIDSLPDMEEQDIVVMELSSFQLMTMKMSPDVAIITNITPNHLDVHKSYEEYIEAKKNIYRNNTMTRVVLNAGNELTSRISEELLQEGRVVDLFSAHISESDMNEINGTNSGCGERIFLKDGIICGRGRLDFELPVSDVMLRGLHNIENLAAAICACSDVITVENIKTVASSFKGVEHRMEFVREVRGVPYYNSSIDSSPNRTINALSVFEGDVVLIAGGKDKKVPFDELGDVLADKVRVLILTGPTATQIEKALLDTGRGDTVKVIHCNNYEEAVQSAYENAREGDVVLLSPASTSFDMFKNFEERGKVFKELVQKLPS